MGNTLCNSQKQSLSEAASIYQCGTENDKSLCGEAPRRAFLLDNDDLLFAVCYVSTRVAHLMIPGRYTCPPNWTRSAMAGSCGYRAIVVVSLCTFYTMVCTYSNQLKDLLAVVVARVKKQEVECKYHNKSK